MLIPSWNSRRFVNSKYIVNFGYDPIKGKEEWYVWCKSINGAETYLHYADNPNDAKTWLIKLIYNIDSEE